MQNVRADSWAEDLGQGQATLDDEITERFPFDVLHRQEEHSIALFHGVDRDDVGMAEGGDALCLTLKTGTAIRIGRSRLGEDLEGNVAFQSGITRPIDLAHAPRAKRRADFIDTEPSACREAHSGAAG